MGLLSRPVAAAVPNGASLDMGLFQVQLEPCEDTKAAEQGVAAQ